MSERKHSPLPWRVRKDELDCIEDMSGEPVAGCCERGTGSLTGKPVPEDLANAALIVECVNAHAALKAQRDELLALCEKLRLQLYSRIPYAETGGHAHKLVDEARALLARIRAVPAGEVRDE